MSLAFLLPLAAAVARMESDPALASLMRGEPGAEAAVVRELDYRHLTGRQREKLLGGLCQVRGMRGRYSAAAAACEAAAAFDKTDVQSARFWRALADVPPPRAIGSAELPIHVGKIGLSEVTANVNGVPVDFGVDTGAEVSIISARLASQLKARPINSKIRIDTSTIPVNGKLAVIDVLELGEAKVENVVVMVLPDKQFDVAEDMRLPPLLGLPILQAFGRIAWLENGRKIAFGDMAPAISQDTGAQLYWHTDGIGLEFKAAKGTFVTHLDTGANRLSLYSDAVPLLSDAERAGIRTRETITGGAGGIIKGQQAHVSSLAATIAGVPVTFSNVPIEKSAEKSGARLGMDYVNQLASLTLDFTTMRVLAVPKTLGDRAGDLSFLAGDWVLSDPSGESVGTSHVTIDLPNAVIHELRRDAQGLLPMWFVRTERGQGGWTQFFPGPRGDLREFTTVSQPGEEPLVLGGDALLTDGRNARFRLTLIRQSNDNSRRVLEISTDGGATWQIIFDYRYQRAGS